MAYRQGSPRGSRVPTLSLRPRSARRRTEWRGPPSYTGASRMKPPIVGSGRARGAGEPSRRRVLAGAAGVAVAGPAAAGTLADVPPRGPGAPLSATREHSE